MTCSAGPASHWLPSRPHRIAISAMKPQTTLTRTQRRLQRRLAQYADPASPVLARFREVRDHTLLDITRGLELIAAELLTRPGHIGLAGGGYVYYPTDATLTRWEATDGSDLKADLLTVVLEYAGTFDDNALDRVCYGDPLDDMVVRRRVDQEGYEAGQLRGDWR